MFFLIRCVFWLTVVFMHIFPQTPVRQEPAGREQAMQGPVASLRLGASTQTWLSSLTTFAERKAAPQCSNAPADCIALAAALSNVATGQRVNSPASLSPSIQAPAQAVTRVAAQVPLPPRRPSLSASFGKLAHARSGLEKSPRAEYVSDHSGRI